MNSSHSGLTNWGLQHVRIESDFSILDVGCGGGKTIQKLAKIASSGHVCGVDYAKGSVAVSRRTNADLIRQGRVEIHEASVSQLPFPPDTFDLVTAIETQYYWPNLSVGMKELLRVLKPGGTLLVILESYRGGQLEPLQRPVMKLLRTSVLTVDEQRALFTSSGYVDVGIFEDKKRSWLCATGHKPFNYSLDPKSQTNPSVVSQRMTS
jgi:SAM-dependent methyltransferase